MKISFVVLHYNSNKNTIKCVDSLIKYLFNDKYQVDIIIVDNGSPEEKIQNINENWMNNPRVHVIISEKNLGFARGNNLGFHYAKYDLKADVIVLANNDLIFPQKDFLEKIDELVSKKKVDIAGPKIILNTNGYNENPVPRRLFNKADIKKRIVKNRILLLLCYLNGADVLAFNYYKRLKKGNENFLNTNDYLLHGSCLIFANRYIKENDGLYDKTFMYGEEDILKYFADINHYNMKYIKDLVVIHKEGGSTPGNYNNNSKKRLFRYKCSIDSLCRLLKLYEKDGQNEGKHK